MNAEQMIATCFDAMIAELHYENVRKEEMSKQECELLLKLVATGELELCIDMGMTGSIRCGAQRLQHHSDMSNHAEDLAAVYRNYMNTEAKK
jgi:hypothetical protein